MIALPGQLFYTTQIPACLWFLTKNKNATTFNDKRGGFRQRHLETLFIDARNLGTMLDRVHKELTTDDIQKITRTYHAWRGEAKDGDYQDVLGFCKSATIDEIKAHDYVLTPGRYVGVEEVPDDSEAFEILMQDLTKTLFKQMAEAEKLDQDIKQNLKGLGYE
jgi:type I restriction enzyme M protein